MSAGVCVRVGRITTDISRRRWSWTAFAAGLVSGIPMGVVGLIVMALILTTMTALP